MEYNELVEKMEYNEFVEKRAYINSILELIFCIQYNVRIIETNEIDKNKQEEE